MKTISRREFIQRSLIFGAALLFPKDGRGAVTERTAGFRPAYELLEREGKLAERIEEGGSMFEECRLCPRECGVNRLDGEKGYCRAPARVVVHSAQPHFGEEKSLVGKYGSGTIFFSNCSLRCVFCQNWPISHMGYGKELGDDELADMMIHLQEIGCHNINLVTPPMSCRIF